MRRTKIVATIGPASEDEATLRGMIEAGMDVARLNLSYEPIETSLARFARIRKVAGEMDRPVGIMIDLPGPKVRIGALPEPTRIEVGSRVDLIPGSDPSSADAFHVNYEGLLSDLRIDDRLTLGDGAIVLQIEDRQADRLVSRAIYGGVTQGRPGIHIPSDRLRLASPTDDDLTLLDAFVDAGVDIVALSFVRSAHDVRRLALEPAPRGPLVVAKIETRAAVENLDGIIAASGAVMVARGDLGAECNIEDLPHLQKDIIARCIALGRPAITATQMLESMVAAPSPTRAEASDVANAVFDGSSAVMLSGETAVGINPVHVVATMARIAERADQEFDYEGWGHHIRRDRLSEPQSVDAAVTDAMTTATWRAASEMGVSTVLCISRSGFTVRAIARFRPTANIVAFSPEPRTIRQLMMSWGATPLPIDRIEDNAAMVHNVLLLAKQHGHIRTGDVVAVLGGSTATVGATDTLRLVRCP